MYVMPHVYHHTEAYVKKYKERKIKHCQSNNTLSTNIRFSNCLR